MRCSIERLAFKEAQCRVALPGAGAVVEQRNFDGEIGFRLDEDRLNTAGIGGIVAVLGVIRVRGDNRIVEVTRRNCGSHIGRLKGGIDQSLCDVRCWGERDCRRMRWCRCER